jgi:2-keto-4-pentenoate hydratase/2-oxohepta-3-ene-1,7-dioic acid hydratase in catechol pathway
MRLVTFREGARTRIGCVVGEEVADLGGAAVPQEMAAFLAGGAEAARAAVAALAHAPRLPLEAVRLEPPILRPRKFLAIGLNYADHIEETGLARPEFPLFFNKQPTCVTGPRDPIWMPRDSEQLDYEGELGFVIARRCRRVPRERAHEVIGGYFVVNDVSIRDWQFRAQTFTLGKSFDTHGPIGPWITTPDELGDPHTLELHTWVNGELRQRSSTKHLVFDCYAQVEALSRACTLEPGDLVSTGTPGGVGMGSKPPRWLRVGDLVRVEIDGLGWIENRVVREPDEG